MDRDEGGVDAPVRRDDHITHKPLRRRVEPNLRTDVAVRSMQARTELTVVIVLRLRRPKPIEPFSQVCVQLRKGRRHGMRLAERVRACRLAAGRAHCLHRMLQLVQRWTQNVHEHEQDRDQVAVARSHGVAGIRGAEARESSARRKGQGGGEQLG